MVEVNNSVAYGNRGGRNDAVEPADPESVFGVTKARSAVLICSDVFVTNNLGIEALLAGVQGSS